MTEHTEATAVVKLSAAYCKLSATASDTDPAISTKKNKNIYNNLILIRHNGKKTKKSPFISCSITFAASLKDGKCVE